MRTRKVIDSHVHLWDLESNYYPWLMDGLSGEEGKSGLESIAHTYLIDHLVEHSDEVDLEGIVHIQADYDPSDPVGETRWLDTYANEGRLKGIDLAIIGFVDLTAPNAECLLEQHCHSRYFRGIRQMLNFVDNPRYCWASQDYLANPQWRQNFSLLSKYQLSFDLMCFDQQMEEASRLAAQHADVPIILEHCGMPWLGEEHDTLWRKGIEALARCDNVACKLGGLGTMQPNWQYQDAQKYFDHLLHHFGVERLMYATNFPTDSVFTSYQQVIRSFSHAMSQLSADEQDQIFRLNARNWYRL
ncbi:amidohydrolase family protein [Thaumasiovibrio sp. DFM-14]|uniref:amidohydrolase family protein n=1 Tax=Thaumasiovibrio sp. DFM-14 TaxID=3384792 RepID=UPI00399F4A84